MKKIAVLGLSLMVLMTTAFTMGCDNQAKKQNKATVTAAAEKTAEKTAVDSGALLTELKDNSALIQEKEKWVSPLARKYDGKTITVFGLVNKEWKDQDGNMNLRMGFSQGETQASNWHRKELYEVIVKMPQTIYEQYKATGNAPYICVIGKAKLQYAWNDKVLDKDNQEDMRGLANFQGNGRGYHHYSLTISAQEIVKK